MQEASGRGRLRFLELTRMESSWQSSWLKQQTSRAPSGSPRMCSSNYSLLPLVYPLPSDPAICG